MNTLVAGGAGFIGSHLIDALIDEGHRVVCVDNMYLGSKQNIEHLIDNNNFILYEEDLSDFNATESIFKKENIDFVFHLAANSDIQASAKEPTIELNNTLLTTFNILECMRVYNVKKIFFASTSAVYGENIKGKMDELSGPLQPISYYGSAKMASEALISSFSHMNNMEVLIFRFPNVIGSRLTHGVVFDFINKLRRNPKELEILGDGTQSKPYMHISDLVKGIINLKNNVSHGILTYNIGVENTTNVTKIADIICEEMNIREVEYKYTGGKVGWKGDVPTFEYNLDKIYATGWKASLDSDDTVRRTVKEVI